MVAPACDAPVPVRAGDAVLGSTGYSAGGLGGSGGAGIVTTTACYPVEVGDGRTAAGYLELAHRDGRRTTLLGSGAALTNERLVDAGDAALALGLLGRHPVLVWWTPDPLDGGTLDEPPSLAALLPAGVRFAAMQLLVALGVVVLWRGRRLGRLVVEPLPVVVRAIETTYGRGQLYRRARARGRAAQVLRAAAVSRLGQRCGLPRHADPHQVAAAVAAAGGRSPADVDALLVGPDPTDDAYLVQLARDLDALETEVHRT